MNRFNYALHHLGQVSNCTKQHPMRTIPSFPVAVELVLAELGERNLVLAFFRR